MVIQQTAKAPFLYKAGKNQIIFVIHPKGRYRGHSHQARQLFYNHPESSGIRHRYYNSLSHYETENQTTAENCAAFLEILFRLLRKLNGDRVGVLSEVVALRRMKL